MIAYLGAKTPGIRRRSFETFSAFARWLNKRGIMPQPWADIEKPRVPKSLPQAPSLEQIQCVLEYIDGHFEPYSALRNKAIVTLLLNLA
jgi:site-specific recombinase XerC